MTSIENMASVVQVYIHLRKDVQVQINMQQFRDPMNIMLLTKAYHIASDWLNNNKAQIIAL